MDPVNCKLPDLDKEPYLRACTILDNAAFLNVVTFIEPTDLLSNNPSINKLFLSNLYEDISDSDEKTVMRWLNYQLYKAGVPRVVENLGSDLKVSAIIDANSVDYVNIISLLYVYMYIGHGRIFMFTSFYCEFTET